MPDVNSKNEKKGYLSKNPENLTEEQDNYLEDLIFFSLEMTYMSDPSGRKVEMHKFLLN